MTQRSILAGWNPTVIVRAGGDVQVEGWDSDRVMANTASRWGLKLDRRGEAIEAHIGASGHVAVPHGSSVTVYAGKGAEVRNIGGSITLYAGRGGYIRGVDALVHASTGGALDFECERVGGESLTCAAGRDLRCFIRALTDARLMINDLGGYWEGVIGAGHTQIRLRAGGDVTIVTDQAVAAQPPLYVLGKIELPHVTS